MELIPILSLIVLVATISTFILAIGAYILYKVRESKGRRAVAPAPLTVEAELFTPQVVTRQEAALQQAKATTNQRTVKRIEKLEAEPSREQQQPGGRPANAQERAYQQIEPVRQPSSAKNQEQQRSHSESEAPGEKSTDKKFMKYTSEGYIPVSKATKTGDNLKWR